MANINKIALPDGTQYDIEDAVAREAISNINSFNIQIVQSLPTTNIDSHTIYLLSKSATVGTSTVGDSTVGGENDTYDEYIYVNNAWEKLGDDINTEAFARVDDIPTKVSELTDDVGIITEWTQSDWSENDSTDPAYVQNRTHYRTLLGHSCPTDIAEYYNSHVDQYEQTFTEIGKSYTYQSPAGYEVFMDNQVFPTNTLSDIDTSATETTVSIDGVSQTLTCTFVNSESATYECDSFYMYNNNVCVLIYEDGIYLVWDIYTNNDSPVSSFVINIPVVAEIYEYTKKLDSNYLNGVLIKSGIGRKSEMFNCNYDYDKEAIGSYSHIEGTGYTSYAEFYLSGEANSTEYTLDDFISKPSGYFDINDLVTREIYTIEGTPSGCIVRYCDESDNLIWLNKSLSETSLSRMAFRVNCSTARAVGDISHVEGESNVAYGYASHVECRYNVARGIASHSEGMNTISTGNFSHSEGYRNIASGSASHVEGGQADFNNYVFAGRITGDANATVYTVNDISSSLANLRDLNGLKIGLGVDVPDSQISGLKTITGVGEDSYGNIATIQVDSSFGRALNNAGFFVSTGNQAKGYSSHAEGVLTQADNYSHSEGFETRAESGGHSEGTGTLAANFSHAEGKDSVAFGVGAHTEGLGTIAHSNYQHVQGKYNITDNYDTYAHIVGNGTSSTRSNAHTLDWSGNGWYAGKLTVGAGPTNNMDVATKQYVDTAIPTVPTYSLSISNNRITLTPSSGSASYIDLPVYNGSVTGVTGATGATGGTS